MNGSLPRKIDAAVTIVRCTKNNWEKLSPPQPTLSCKVYGDKPNQEWSIHVWHSDETRDILRFLLYTVQYNIAKTGFLKVGYLKQQNQFASQL